MDTHQKTSSFIVKDCSISTLAIGMSAGSLIDLREKLFLIPLDSIYYHFWIARLRPHFEHSGYHNDFALWAHHVLNEPVLAEKLSIIDPLHFPSLESLRDAIVENIDESLDEKASVAWSKKEHFFHFMTSRIIVMNTLREINQPEDLLNEVDHLSTSSIFYHFIDSRHHTKASKDDFSLWLKAFGPQYDPLIAQLSDIDIYFLTFPEIKKRLSTIVHDFFR